MLQAIPSTIGLPRAAALDAGSVGPATLAACAKRASEPDIATDRDPHHPSWQQRFAPLPDPPSEDGSAQVNMADKRRTVLGKVIDGARTCTGEPVIGIIKEVPGFRPFSWRGTAAATGEWCLVCVAFHLKRFQTSSWAEEEAKGPFQTIQTICDAVLAAIVVHSGALAGALNDTYVLVWSTTTIAVPFSPTTC
ncbi:MAG TPA: hypothetical protein VGF67_26040 [Ktedonobacteraceae bacterium]|jgi:hypothetical protein